MKDQYEGMDRPGSPMGSDWLQQILSNPFTWTESTPGQTSYFPVGSSRNQFPGMGGSAGSGGGVPWVKATPKPTTISANPFGTGDPLNWQNPLFGGGAGTGAGAGGAAAGAGGLSGLSMADWLKLAGTAPALIGALNGSGDLPYGSEMERLIAELTRQQQQADPLRRALLAWAQGMVPTYARG